MSIYPRDLIPTIRGKCAERDRREYSSSPPLPADAVLEVLLDTAFHASFLSEEGRRPGFRIIFLPPTEEFSEPDRRYFENDFRRIPFERPRPYSVAEINRLAPAAELTRLLICVHPLEQGNQPELAIWGLLDVGENWWRYVHHATSGGKPPPNALTITSLNPGEIVVSAEGEVLVSLRSGAASFPETTALWAGPVSDFLGSARRQLHDDAVARLNSTCWDKRGHDEDYPQRLYVFFLERILFSIRERRHGGTLVMLPYRLSRSDTRITDRLFIKYPCDYNCVWDTLLSSLINHRRYYELHFPLWDATTAMTQESFREYSMLSGEAEKSAPGSDPRNALIRRDKSVIKGWLRRLAAPFGD